MSSHQENVVALREVLANESLCKMVLWPRLLVVLQLRLGLHGQRSHTFQRVGEIIGKARDASSPVERTRARQIYLKALRILKLRLDLFGKALHDPDDPYFTPLWFGHPKPNLFLLALDKNLSHPHLNHLLLHNILGLINHPLMH